MKGINIKKSIALILVAMVAIYFMFDLSERIIGLVFVPIFVSLAVSLVYFLLKQVSTETSNVDSSYVNQSNSNSKDELIFTSSAVTVALLLPFILLLMIMWAVKS